MASPANKATAKTPMHAALTILARRQVSTGQMRSLLLEKGFAPHEIQECIEKLEEWGYLNDVALARNIVEALIRDTPCGKRRCLYELEKRQFDEEVAKMLVEQIYSQYDEGDLAQAAARQYARNKTEWTQKDTERLARWLYRRGFDRSTVLSVVRTFGQAEWFECE